MDQTCSFKNRELLIIKENANILLYSSLFWNSTKFQGKRASRFGTGARGIWQSVIFTYFFSSSPLRFLWHISFNLARSTCSFYWCYIFSFEYSWSKNVNTEEKSTYHSIDIGKQNKEKILENNVNVQKQLLEVFYKKGCT